MARRSKKSKLNSDETDPISSDEKRKIKARETKANQKIRKIKNHLKEVDAGDFGIEFLKAVYYNDIVQHDNTADKIELDDLEEGETLHWYMGQQSKLTETLVGGSQVEVKIIPCIWYECHRTDWDSDKERKAKKEKNNTNNSHAWSLKGIFNMNIDKKYRDKSYMEEYANEPDIIFGEYNNRPFVFTTKFEVLRVEVIENYVVPGFVKGAKYSYNERKSMQPPEYVYWNGKSIDTTNLLYVKLKDTDKYVIIDQAEQSERNLVIDNPSLEEEIVAFYRVGDFLTREEINRILTTCSSFKHAIPSFIYICVKYRHLQLLKKHELATKTEENIEVKKEKEVIAAASKFAKALRTEMCNKYQSFKISWFVRMTWITWSCFSIFDKMFGEKWYSKRINAKKRAKATVPKQEEQQLLEDTMQLDNTMILAITQSGADEKVFKLFRCISDGFDTLHSYFKPLERMHVAEYYEVLLEICRPFCGLYGTRALTILSLLVTSAILFNGKAPTESIDILSFWQVDEKKSNLIRNCIKGVYNGVGTDRHVIAFFNAWGRLKGLKIIDEKNKRVYKNKESYHLGATMPEDPGAYLNEVVGECSQAFGKRKTNPGRWKTWYEILKTVSKQNEEFKKFIDEWLSDWDIE